MRNLLYFFSICLLLTSCNDGDIITVDIDFGDTFSYCETDGIVVFYKTKSDPSESLTLKLNDSINGFIELDEENMLVESSVTFTLNGSTNRFNYRTYNATLPTSYFCEAITPNIGIINDSESSTGTVTVDTTLTEDDNDGIPANVEDENLDGDDDPATNPTDTDLDGIPNYLDDDDDGDNVPTSTEKPNYTTTDGLANALDTDGDGTPDYLDTDDDGDGIDTINEENNTQDQNPTNDITDITVGADYLNEDIATEVLATAYREHTIEQTFTITAKIYDFDLVGLLSQDYYDFGSTTVPVIYRTKTPEFP